MSGENSRNAPSAKESSLADTIPFSNVDSAGCPERFYSAHPEIVRNDQLQREPDNEPASAPVSVQGAVPPHTQLEVLPRLRVLFERLSVDNEQPTVGSQQAGSFSVETKVEEFTVLGATHNHTQMEYTLTMDNTRITMVFLPWTSNALVTNKSPELVRFTKNQDGTVLDVRRGRNTVLDPGYWVLQHKDVRLGFQLRPCQYHLSFLVESKKRTAEATPSSSKAARASTGHRHERSGIPVLQPEETGKSVVQRALPDEIDNLSCFGVPQGYTLLLIDSITGETEYSIKRFGEWSVRRPHIVVFKAALNKGGKVQAVVVKIHKPIDNNERSIQHAIYCWKREVKAHCGLQHERIAGLVGFDSRMLMLAVNLTLAHDLGSSYWCYQRSAARPWFFKGTLDDAYSVCADISSALKYLEEKGIVHGDVKPLNIMYSRDEGATLIDFGLSHSIKEDRIETGGTPWYKDEEYRDLEGPALGDIFSLGVAMLYLIGEMMMPEKEQADGWVIREAYQGVPRAVAAEEAWHAKVRAKKEGLEALLPESMGSKEAKLRRLTSRMLARRARRITARELAKEMAEQHVRAQDKSQRQLFRDSCLPGSGIAERCFRTHIEQGVRGYQCIYMRLHETLDQKFLLGDLRLLFSGCFN